MLDALGYDKFLSQTIFHKELEKKDHTSITLGSDMSYISE
jgi:hypothetical protein